MMHNFNPGDKVIKRTETDASKYGISTRSPFMGSVIKVNEKG